MTVVPCDAHEPLVVTITKSGGGEGGSGGGNGGVGALEQRHLSELVHDPVQVGQKYRRQPS